MDIQRPTYFVGSRQMMVEDIENNITFPVLVHYPTFEPSVMTAFGPYQMDVSPNAAIAEGLFPLVVISHGSGGSHLLYRTISTHLAKQGYVVVMPEHCGNNRNDNGLAGAKENLAYRPKHVSLCMDAVCRDTQLGPCIDAQKAAVIGHSMGGYTALAVAGGKPISKSGEPVAVTADTRVKALVLLAPATVWFMHDHALDLVNQPIMMLMGEHDKYTPLWHADVVLERVPDASKVNCRVVQNAGHFSFLSPFPTHMVSPEFYPSTDPEGFDREQFHKSLPAEISDYLDKILKE